MSHAMMTPQVFAIREIAVAQIDFFFFFLLKVANIRCFILIAVEIFHYIIRK
jgi:hypothetical protein